MIEKLKNIGWIGLGLSFWVLILVLTVFFTPRIADFIGNNQDLLSSISGVIIGIILLLLVLSVVPSWRAFTGIGIIYASSAWIFMLWLNCLAITYGIWGVIGIFIGVVMFGFGIIATAILASFLTGQWIGALILLATLAVMYGTRMLGAWIATKDRSVTESESLETGIMEDKEPETL